jgi:DNA repair protein RadC
MHGGHRERMKKRFSEHGLDNFDDLYVIELLLFYVIPRRETNTIAHALFERFGSLEEIFEAPIPELMKVNGVGEKTATFLKLIPQISRRYMIDKTHTEKGNIISSTTQAGAYFVPLFMYEKDEVIYMICLDSKCRLICCRQLGRGVVNAAEVSIRQIVETALSYSATSVILAHNHINGLALPSREDEMSTRQISSALSLVGIVLADHIIVAGDDYVSLADSGLIRHGR